MDFKNRFIVSFLIASFLTILLFLFFQVNPGKEMNTLETIPLTDWKEIYESNKDNSEYVILDVRTPEEFNKNKIDGSINLNFYDSDFKNQLNQLDKSKTYLIYCRSGARSGNTLNMMKELGFQTVYDLQGGINAWNSALN